MFSFYSKTSFGEETMHFLKPSILFAERGELPVEQLFAEGDLGPCYQL